MLTTGDALKWLDEQGATHFGSNAVLYKTALSRIVSCRLPDEPDDSEWILKHLDTLAHRLAKRASVQGGSLKAYISRARRALEAHRDWSKNPVGWSPKNGKAPTQKRRKEAGASEAQDEIAVAPSTPQPAAGLQEEINQALVAIARWPNLQPFLVKGLMEAMDAQRKGEKK
jgi:hypothetical protein